MYIFISLKRTEISNLLSFVASIICKKDKMIFFFKLRSDLIHELKTVPVILAALSERLMSPKCGAHYIEHR